MCEKCNEISGEMPTEVGSLDELIALALGGKAEESMEDQVNKAASIIGGYIMAESEVSTRDRLGVQMETEEQRADWDRKIMTHGDVLVEHLMEDFATATAQLQAHMTEIMCRLYLEGTVQDPNEFTVTFERTDDEE